MLVIVAAVTDMVPGQLHVLDTMDGQGTGMFDFEPLLTQLAAQHIQGIVHGGHAYGDEAVDSRLRLAHGFVADPADGLAAGGLDEALDGVRKGCVIDAPLDVEGKIVLILEVRIRHVHGQALDGPVHTLQGLFRQDASRHAAAQGQKAQLLEIEAQMPLFSGIQAIPAAALFRAHFQGDAYGAFDLFHQTDDCLGRAVEFARQVLLEMAPVIEEQLAEKTQQLVTGTGIGIQFTGHDEPPVRLMLDADMP